MIVYFLPAILFLGIVTSYDDIKFRKIRNKYIVLALCYSLLVNIGIWTYQYFTTFVDVLDIVSFSVNVLITLTISFLMWKNDLWGAGDAKLFVAYAALLPLVSYSNTYLEYFPSLVILINTFLPFLFYALFAAIFLTSTGEKIQTIRRIKMMSLLYLFLNFFSISWIVHLITKQIGLHGIFIIYLTTFMLYYLIAKLPKKIKKKIYQINIIIFFARFLFDPDVISASFWIVFLTHTFVFMFVRFFLINLVKEKSLTVAKLTELKEGMKFSDFVISSKFKPSKDSSKMQMIKPDDLTNAEIVWIKKNKKRFGISAVKITEYVPFAPMFFLGVLITIVFQGSFITGLKMLIVALL